MYIPKGCMETAQHLFCEVPAKKEWPRSGQEGTLGRLQLRDGLQNERPLLFETVKVMKMGQDLGNALVKE